MPAGQAVTSSSSNASNHSPDARGRLTIFCVWLVLVASTLASFVVANHTFGIGGQSSVTTVIILLAAMKMILIAAVFMELLASSKALLCSFTIYILTVATTLIGIYR